MALPAARPVRPDNRAVGPRVSVKPPARPIGLNQLMRMDVSQMTPAQIARLVQLQVAAAIQPERNYYQGQINQTEKIAQQRAQIISGLSRAYGQMLSGVAPQTQQEYQGAADRTALYSRGLGDAMNAATDQQGADMAATMGKFGAPGEQISQEQNLAGAGGAAGNIAYEMGGNIPASTLEREGAAFTAANAGLPATAQAYGQRYLSQNFSDANKIEQQYRDARSKLMATVPQLRAQEQNAVNQQILNAEKQKRSDIAMQLMIDRYGLSRSNAAFDRTKFTQTEADKAQARQDRLTARQQALAQKQQANHEKALTKRNGTVASTLTRLSTYVHQQMTKTGRSIVGYQPESRLGYPDPTLPPTVLAKTPKEVEYLRKDGTWTANKNDPNIVKKPIYGASGQARPVNLGQLRNYVLQQLRINLRRFGYDEQQFQAWADMLLGGIEGATPASASALEMGKAFRG